MVTTNDNLLGLNEYEGRVYRAMLVESPATAYRLGKLSGVPLSRVYEIAARLVEKGAASVLAGEPARYVPAPPDALVAQARARLVHDLDALHKELTAFASATADPGYAWLKGENAVLTRAKALVCSASEELSIASAPGAWEPLGALLDGRGEGVLARRAALPASTRHDASFLLLADSQEALIGRLGAPSDALSTCHPAIVRVCVEFFRFRTVADAAREMVAATRPTSEDPTRWLGWEEEKQRRLLHVQ